MSMPNAVLSGVGDRIAEQVAGYRAVATSGANNGMKMYPRIHRAAGLDGNFELESALIDSFNGLDNNTVSGTLFKSLYSSPLTSLEQYFIDQGAESFDSYCDISGINFHPNFDEAWYQSKGTHLNAVNIFYSAADQLTLGSYFATGSGTGVFTAGTSLGTGTGKVSATNFAAGKLVLVPINTVQGTVAQLNILLTRESGQSSGSTTAFDNLRIPASTTSGQQYPVGNWANSGINNLTTFLSVTNIVGGGATSGDGFKVMALRERNTIL